MVGWQNAILQRFIYPPIQGAYTELFAGLSPDITQENNGAWSECAGVLEIHLLTFTVVPWGRFAPLRADLEASSKSEAEGGTGIGNKFWEWSEDQVKSFL